MRKETEVDDPGVLEAQRRIKEALGRFVGRKASKLLKLEVSEACRDALERLKQEEVIYGASPVEVEVPPEAEEGVTVTVDVTPTARWDYVRLWFRIT